MKKVILYSLIWVIIDQITKWIVSTSLILGETISILPNFFSFTYVKNTGAAWSILEGNTIFLILVSLIAIGIIYIFLLKEKKLTHIHSIIYGILFGGIIGNLIDRILLSSVIDFIHFTLGSYEFPIFNVADIGIVLGSIGLFWIMYKEDKNGNRYTK